MGKATANELEALGVTTIGQLQASVRPPSRRAPRPARPRPPGARLRPRRKARRAVLATQFEGAETTFGRDCRDLARWKRRCGARPSGVARELRAERLAACRVTLKLRWADFTTLTRSHTGDPTQDGLEIYRRATTLLARERLIQPVRLIGVSASTFRPEARGQLPLLDPAAVRREQLARAVDRITGRFGRSAIVPARLLDRPDALE